MATVKTLWGLFPDFETASAALSDFLREGFGKGDISVVLQNEVARKYVRRNDMAAVAQARAAGQQPPAELDDLLAGHQPLRVPDTGPLIVDGTLGAVLGQTASRVDASSGGLEGALVDFGLPPSQARRYKDGVFQGKVLFAMRVGDERLGQAAAIMGRNHAQDMTDYP